jgi:hypothetical protein
MKYIYIYETPASKEHGLIKIGDARDVDRRIKGQINTASAFDASSLSYSLIYQTDAIKFDGSEFRDHDIHSALVSKGYAKHQIVDGDSTLKGTTEWFKIEPDKVIHLIKRFKAGDLPEVIDIERFQTFGMRPEQEAAVKQTVDYFNTQSGRSGPIEMLWNAKMRFGKTFTAYQLGKRMGLQKILVITYKPAVEDAWQKDLEHHADFAGFVFLKRDNLSQINSYLTQKKKVVAFASFQDLLGTKDDKTSIKDKHKELFDTDWDLVIVDEFHYGAGTKKAKQMLADQVDADNGSKSELVALEKELSAEEDEEEAEEEASEIVAELAKQIGSTYVLYLSGTPFKAMANAQFDARAIFNWTYADEQKAKHEWAKNNPLNPDGNPYIALPEINMYLYQVSQDLIKAGIDEGKDEFSLNHFFKTKSKSFINEEAIVRWLNLISGVVRPDISINDAITDDGHYVASQYPFDHEGRLIHELDHTLWYLHRVSSAEALKKLLEAHPVFCNYHIILAAGKGTKSGVDALQPVLDAMDRHDKTITITVGKLTTGVSVPKWKGVLFLRDISSPENYFQTAFRAQTPFFDKASNWRKETCYIIDFSPNRSLKLLTTYSEKLSPDSHLTTSEAKISEFIRYLPVLKVQGNRMVSMDAREVLTFDLSGVDAKGLGERFIERKNVVVTRATIEAINETAESQKRCQDIFDKIKKFRKFNGASDSEVKNSDANVIDLDVNDKKVKQLETKTPKTPDEKKNIDKETAEAEKELKSERDKVRELLRTLLSRVPIFMYLTNATEENLEQVLIDTENDLFRKTTGISIEDFRFLKDVGLIRVESIDGYILKFVQLESQNYEINNILR